MSSPEKPTRKPQLLSTPFSVLSLLHPRFTEMHRQYNQPQLPKSAFDTLIVAHDPPKNLGQILARFTMQTEAKQPVEATEPITPIQAVTPIPPKLYVRIAHVSYYPNPAIVPYGQPPHLYPGNFARYLTTSHELFYDV